MRMNIKQIQQATGGIYLYKPLDLNRFAKQAVIDSRLVSADDMFVVFTGEKVDGHEFVYSAIESGAAVVLVEKPVDEKTKWIAERMDAAILQVDNAQESLRNVALAWRKHLSCRVLGITGSSGKTTTKNLVRDVLSVKYRTVATKGNFNNELGVPITLTSVDPEHEIAVIEMGTQSIGEIKDLCEIAQPQWGLLTIIGTSHIEIMGSQENIAIAKSELTDALPNGVGIAFLNASDKYTSFVAKHSDIKNRGIETILYGHKEYNNQLGGRQVWAENIELDKSGCPRFFIHANGFCDGSGDKPIDQVVSCRLKLMGLHNVQNACAAAAVGCACGISLFDCVKAINASLPESGRQEIVETARGVSVIDDAYNASPESMEASLRMFAALSADGRKIAVLGDMAELGEYSKSAHEKIGKIVVELGVSMLICVGKDAGYIAKAAEDTGMDKQAIIRYEEAKAALRMIENEVLPGDYVLVKASNCMGLNYIVKGLVS